MHVSLIVSWPGEVASTPGPNDDSNYRTYDGLIDIIDLYPTLLEAAGIAMPQAETIDGISFWSQAIGASSEEHRDHIYTWYNANHAITDLAEVLRYAFNKEFKRYAPHASFPDGRFFDLRSDPIELVGDRQVTIYCLSDGSKTLAFRRNLQVLTMVVWKATLRVLTAAMT